MVGAYCFSQMGKYIPGKIALLLMRIERAGRFGMTAGTCTLSTLQENALYIISGAFTGMLAMTHISDALPPKFHLVRAAIWPASIGVIAILGAACHPRVFYGLVGALLKKMKKPSIAPEQKLGEVTLLLGVLAFVPCWAFGGFALWASTCTLHVVPIGDCFWFIGAFSLSVIIGMISFLPGGTGIREAVLGIAVMLQLSRSGMDHDQAVLIGALVAVVQRVCQIAAELLVGIAGAVLTRRSAATAEISAPGGATVGG
jgi:uncharacterized membrane protein YbhN (UPF0104 family)